VTIEVRVVQQRQPAPAAKGEGTVQRALVTRTWVTRTWVRRVDVSAEQGGGDASVLAIRAVELLRATLMQAATEGEPAPDVESRRDLTPSRAPGPPSSPRRSWGVAIGAALLQSLRGFGSALGPEARVSLRPASGPGVEVTLVGPTFARDLTAPAGSASLRQQLASADATWSFRRRGALVPMASVGIGLYHLRTAGSAPAGEAVSRTLWAPIVGAGVGLVIVLSATYAVRIDARAMSVQPSPYIQIGGQVAGHAGRPLLLFSVAVERGLPRIATR
jgi:hypothetical protein